MTFRQSLSHMRLDHIAMAARGAFWQLLHLRFGMIVLKGRGAKIWIDRRIRVRGIIKVGDFATLDLRYCRSGKIGPTFSLGNFSIMRASGSPAFTCPNIDIGCNVSFGPYCNVGGGFGLRIADGVIAGPYVSIHPEEHGMSSNRPIRAQRIHGCGISIGRDCWLGAKATLLDGTVLADGTVVGAGTIMTGCQTQPNGIYVGVPARFRRFRDTSESNGAML